MEQTNLITEYIERGKGEPIILLHGLFGALSNWENVIDHFSKKYRVIAPTIPIYGLPIKDSTLPNFMNLIHDFIVKKDLTDVNLVGNSLGGHLAIMYTLKHPTRIKNLILTGSSGLFEDSMGGSFPKRGNYEYIDERARYTVFDPKILDKSYVDEIFEVINDSYKALRVISVAKSAQRNNLAEELPKISQKTLLIWGINDTITPAAVGHQFSRLIPNSTLKFIDSCCHAPMMENSHRFNEILEDFLKC